MMDLGTFTWANLLTLIGMLTAGAITLLTVWWNIEQRIRGVEIKAKHDLSNVEMKAQSERTRIEKDLADFKLHVVKEYASYDTVQQANARLESRIEQMAQDVSRMPDVVVDRIMRFLDLKKTS
jgi:hypothetical protein